MKTRDRILECALQLFNEKGEPNVSTMEVANEMGISLAISTTTFTARSR
jgi:AcrR family transcriptional regulator